jgi:hypothetical protein
MPSYRAFAHKYMSVVLTWGASGQGGDSFMRPHSFQLTWLVRFDFSVFVSVGRYFAAGKVSGASDNIR